MENHQKSPPRRGLFLLPNLLTTAALFAGFHAIIAAIDNRFEAAAISIFVAMVFDGLDGRVARMTNTQSDFGAEYDSLSDMVSFGLAPALIVYQWSLQGFGKIGWLAAFLYTSSAALRLARFNTQIGTLDKQYFQGLASPSAAALLASLVWYTTDLGFENGNTIAPITLTLTVLVALLMISKFRYHSFKGLDLRGRLPVFTGVIIVLAFVLISINPSLMLLLSFLGYASSGPLYTILQLRRHRAIRKH